MEKEIAIVIESGFITFCVDSYVCGFHVSKEPWFPLIGEESFECPKEKKND